jgi:hypothetical protein
VQRYAHDETEKEGHRGGRVLLEEGQKHGLLAMIHAARGRGRRPVGGSV